jgi:hydroxyacylglutathione hydrolase
MTPISITSCVVGDWQTNSYLLAAGNCFVIIDPGDDIDKLQLQFEIIQQPCAKIIIFATHGHFDHVGAVEFFKTKYKCSFGLHSKDKRILGQANLYRKITGVKSSFPTPEIDFYFDELENYIFSDYDIKIHNLPGHTDGSVAFELNGSLFCGDLILNNTLGRVDLPGGNKKKLLASTRLVLDRFLGYTIYPGHGKPFVLTSQKANFFMEQIIEWERL